MARLGMDVESVEVASRELKQQAAQIGTLVSSLDRAVRSLSSVWDGRDAERFMNDWWPKHRSQLESVARDIGGLGQSAWNNAQEQREVSGGASAGKDGGGTGGWSAPGVVSGGGADPVDDGVRKSSPSGSQLNPPFDVARSQSEFDNRSTTSGGDLARGRENDGQCTSWAYFRREQLGLPTPHGDGKRMAESLITRSDDPSPGAVGSYGGDWWGHTFIVEKVTSISPPTIEISEMNYGLAIPGQPPYITTGTGKVHSRTLIRGGDGLWRADGVGTSTPYDITFGQ